MTEQYIYSRSEREFTNSRNQTVSLGFGFVALSPGMNGALKLDAAAHCEDCPRIFLDEEQEGSGLPLLRKVRLPKGRVLLQKSAWIEKGSRDFHVAHGYLLEEEAVKAAGPDQWLALPFQLGDPNEAEGGILLDSLPELPFQKFPSSCGLKEAALGLDQEQFCQLVLACFDALATRRQVLIAWDFERPEARQLRLSVLYWLYACLPQDLRVGLGFDSVFTEKSSLGQIHLAFVDKRAVVPEGQRPSIQLGDRQLPLGGNFLVLDGAILHGGGKYKTDWYGSDGPYTRWLGKIVDVLWAAPAEKGKAAAQALDELQQGLQRQLNSEPEERRLTLSAYDRACASVRSLGELEAACGRKKCVAEGPWCAPAPAQESRPSGSEDHARNSQHQAQQISAADIQSQSNMGAGAAEQQRLRWCQTVAARYRAGEDAAAYIKCTLDELPGLGVEQRRSLEDEIWRQLFQAVYRRSGVIPAREDDISLLSAMCGSWMGDAAMGLMGGLMVREADAAKDLWRVLCRYRTLPSEIYVQLLRGLFWDELNGAERAVWKNCGAKDGINSVRKRRSKLYAEILAAYVSTGDMAAHIKNCLDVFLGADGPHRAKMEEELQVCAGLAGFPINGGSGT